MSHGRERLYRTEAVILHRQDLGETDRLLTLYTPDQGKVRAIAKGVRRPSSRKAGHLELFMHSALLVAKGRNLDIVTQAEAVHPFRALREDLDRITYAHYAAELLDRFASEGQENQPAFALLVETLNRLCEAHDLPLTVRYYELRLLALEGYQPQLFRCLHCEDVIQPVTNYFDPEAGGVLCPRCGEGLIARPGMPTRARPVSVNALKVLRFLQTRDYETCSRLRLTPETANEIESLMLHYITYILERSLRSVDFIRRLRRERANLRTPGAAAQLGSRSEP
ncbi:MAG: DNA repair protein RecO [Anaerolineae bacterium]|nr:DNA repair protein RecO [Anaerolineae bacterium]